MLVFAVGLGSIAFNNFSETTCSNNTFGECSGNSVRNSTKYFGTCWRRAPQNRMLKKRFLNVLSTCLEIACGHQAIYQVHSANTFVGKMVSQSIPRELSKDLCLNSCSTATLNALLNMFLKHILATCSTTGLGVYEHNFQTHRQTPLPVSMFNYA